MISVPHYKISGESQLQTFYASSLSQGYEGVVMKQPLSLYKAGKTDKWLKLKELAEPIDLEVIDIYEGKGKYEGLLGGVVVSYNGKRVNVGGGFTDTDRVQYFAHPHLIVGKIIEVKYQEVTGDGSLRNPIFLRIRDK